MIKLKETKWIAVTAILLTSVMGCADQIDSHRHRLSFGVETKSFPAIRNVPAWPEHWIVVKENDGASSVVDLDQNMILARNAFYRYDISRTLQALHDARVWLTKERQSAPESHLSEYDKAIGAFQKLSEKIERGDALTISEFDQSLEDAYPENLSVLWSAEKTEEEFRFMKRPSPHFARARNLLNHKDRVGAAEEVRRGADWLTLVVLDSAEQEDRDNLHKAIARLRRVANEIENGEATSTADLHQALAAADRAYAFYYMHWAEKERMDKAFPGWFTMVDALTDDLSTGSQWVSHQFEKGEHALFGTLQSIGNDMEHEERLAEKKVRRTVQNVDEKIAPKWTITGLI